MHSDRKMFPRQNLPVKECAWANGKETLLFVISFSLIRPFLLNLSTRSSKNTHVMSLASLRFMGTSTWRDGGAAAPWLTCRRAAGPQTLCARHSSLSCTSRTAGRENTTFINHTSPSTLKKHPRFATAVWITATERTATFAGGIKSLDCLITH